ncbi:MAG TPA: sensor histidine kinase [Bacteroidales bacterium]|nr:sensor histidine kinase [Bacteroidales bacterium]
MKRLNPKSKTLVNIALHLLIWGFWFAAPILFSFSNPQRGEPPREPFFYYFIWIPMLFSLILFYLNYFILINKFLFNEKLFWFFLTNISLIILFSYFSDQLRHLFQSRPVNPQFSKPPKEFFFGLRHFTFFFIVSISVAIRTTSRWYATETQRKNLENENLKSKLSNLKMQLNPHFFFNTLNNIYSLIKVSPEKAQESVHGLAKLMRYHLYETNEEKVPLSAEVDFLENYIALMKIRMNPNVIIETDFSIENPTAQIAPLLFISLVENSFKHGISPTEESFIKILMTEKDKILSFIIMNTDYPQKREGNRETGIGFENLKKRLELIYPDKHNLTQSYKSKFFHVNVTIQL